jgi:hypothetical protein
MIIMMTHIETVRLAVHLSRFYYKISAFTEAGKKLMSRILYILGQMTKKGHMLLGQMTKKGHMLNEKKMIKYIRY